MRGRERWQPSGAWSGGVEGDARQDVRQAGRQGGGVGGAECTPGKHQACEDCPILYQFGARTCAADGTWGTCDCSGETVPDVPAGTVGRCIETEVAPGKVVCLLSAPQDFSIGMPLEAQLNPGKADAPLDLPDKSDDLFMDCLDFEIHDQGPFGWCTVNAMTGAMELAYCRAHWKTQKLSESHLWKLGHGMDEPCDGGWFIGAAAQTAELEPLVPYPEWPMPGPPFEDGCAANEQEAKDLEPKELVQAKEGMLRLTSHYPVQGRSSQAVKAALAQGHPVAYSFPIFDNTGWNESTEDETFPHISAPEEPPPMASDGQEWCRCDCLDSKGKPIEGCEECFPPHDNCLSGYHAVLLAAYDDFYQSFRVVNSWGYDWNPGNDVPGTFFIGYDYVDGYGRGGRAVDGVVNCREETCYPVEDPTPDQPDIVVPEGGWIVEGESVRIIVPEGIECTEPGVDIDYVIKEREELESVIAGIFPNVGLYADPMGPYLHIDAQTIDFNACSWKGVLGWPAPEEQPRVYLEFLYEGQDFPDLSVLRSNICLNDWEDPMMEWDPHCDQTQWQEVEAKFDHGIATVEVPMGALEETANWVVARNICKGKKVVHSDLDMSGYGSALDPAENVVGVIECLEGTLAIHGTGFWRRRRRRRTGAIRSPPRIACPRRLRCSR
ncbi:MAG: C1 family peptidase [Pseudomonadota bacterium]